MQKTLDHLDFLSTHILKTENYLNKKKLDSIQYCCIGLLSRLRHCSKGLRYLLANINGNPTLEFSCGIILRSSLLDSLIALNIYKILIETETTQSSTEEKKDILAKFCETILGDGLKHSVKYVESAYEANVIDRENMINTFINLTRNHSRFFNPYPGDGTLPNLKDNTYYSPERLFKMLANTPDLKNLTSIYNFYQFFSKYDHFGILYFDVINYTFIEQLERTCGCVEFLVGTCSFLHLALRMYSEDDFLIEQSNVAAEYLFKNIINPPNEKRGDTIY